MVTDSGFIFVGLGFLLFLNGAALFYAYLALLIFALRLIPGLVREGIVIAKSAAVILVSLGSFANAADLTGDSLTEKWQIKSHENRLYSEATLVLTGKPGDRLKILQAPATLTGFSSPDLLLKKIATKKDGSIDYFVIIPTTDPFASDVTSHHQITYTYQMQLGDIRKGFTKPTPQSSIHHIQASYDEPGWAFSVPDAARIGAIGQRGKYASAAQWKSYHFAEP